MSLKSSVLRHVSSLFLPYLYTRRVSKKEANVKNLLTAFGTKAKRLTKIDTETMLTPSGSKAACFGTVYLLRSEPPQKLVFIKSCQIRLFRICHFYRKMFRQAPTVTFRRSQFTTLEVTVEKKQGGDTCLHSFGIFRVIYAAASSIVQSSPLITTFKCRENTIAITDNCYKRLRKKRERRNQNILFSCK